MAKNDLLWWRKKIENEVPFVDVKPYSHNIIGVALRAIAKEFGRDEAVQAMKDFNLVSLGWRIPENK